VTLGAVVALGHAIVGLTITIKVIEVAEEAVSAISMSRTGATAVVTDADVGLTLLVTTVDDVSVSIAGVLKLLHPASTTWSLGFLAKLVVVAGAATIALTVVSTGRLIDRVTVLVDVCALRYVLAVTVTVTGLAQGTVIEGIAVVRHVLAESSAVTTFAGTAVLVWSRELTATRSITRTTTGAATGAL